MLFDPGVGESEMRLVKQIYLHAEAAAFSQLTSMKRWDQLGSTEGLSRRFKQFLRPCACQMSREALIGLRGLDTKDDNNVGKFTKRDFAATRISAWCRRLWTNKDASSKPCDYLKWILRYRQNPGFLSELHQIPYLTLRQIHRPLRIAERQGVKGAV
jgi:hypothetical protein